MLGQAGDVVVDAVDLVQDSIRIRVVFCCPWHVTLQVSYRTACRVRAALTGNQRGVGGEDFKGSYVCADTWPPVVGLVDPVVEPEG